MGATSAREHRDAEAIDAPTQQLVAASVGDRCTSCGSLLASDQRYCVSCGERRGRSRFSFAGLAPQTVETTTTVREGPRRPRMSSGSTLIAGIGVLLLAMGLGLLIGRLGQTSNPRTTAAAPQQIVVNGGGGTSTGSSGTGSTSGGGSSSNSTGSAKAKHTSAAANAPLKRIVITKQVAAKAQAAATQALGGSTKLAPPTATTGSACASGAGCQGGKFTGNFFGQ